MIYRDFIDQNLKRASTIAIKQFGKVTGSTKTGDNNQVLTEADLAIGKLLIDLIQKTYPTHNIIDEEAGVVNRESELTWVIDPIDGTSNFSAGVVTYGIMMGLLQGSTPIAGGIALPTFSEVCVAEKGVGAFCNGQKLQVTNSESLLSELVAYAIDGHQENPIMTHDECATLADIILGIRNLRASGSCFDAVMVAKGKYGGYLNRTSKIWDNVAQQIVLEEAGCVYTDFFGRPIDYSNPLAKVSKNFTFCAAPPLLHKQLQSIISQNGRKA